MVMAVVVVAAAVFVVVHQGIAIANQPPGMHACRLYGSYFYIPRYFLKYKLPIIVNAKNAKLNIIAILFYIT